VQQWLALSEENRRQREMPGVDQPLGLYMLGAGVPSDHLVTPTRKTDSGGKDLWVGFGGDVPVIYGENWGVCEICAPGCTVRYCSIGAMLGYAVLHLVLRRAGMRSERRRVRIRSAK
jgi:hypothetical protein